RFVRELARLEALERELAAASAAAALRQAQARSRQQELPKEETDRLASQQAEVTRRTEKLLAAMRSQAAQPDNTSDFGERLADAVAAADKAQLTRKMGSASRDVE